VICPEHHAGIDRGLPLSLTALKTLRYMQTRSWDAIRGLNINGRLHLELERLTLAYLTYVLEQRLAPRGIVRGTREPETLAVS